MKMDIKHSAVASGTGRIKVSDLKELVESVPPEATLSIKEYSNQRDGSSWTISAEWDSIAQANWRGDRDVTRGG